MKKVSFVAAAALIVAVATSCNKSAPKADLASDIDSLSYAFGLEQAQGVQGFFQQMDIDSTQMDQFIKGLQVGADGSDDKSKKAFNAGIMVGQQIMMMQQNYAKQLFEGDSTKSLSKDNFLAGFIAGATGKDQKLTIDQARLVGQRMAMAIQTKHAEKKYAKEKAAADAYMAANAKKEGVQKLGKGVQYKVLKEGKGAIPANNDIVLVNYEGKTTDGKTFDQRDNAKMPVGGLIPGMTEAISHMPVGSKWEIYIPYSAGYGSQQVSQDIKPFSNLIFTVEVLGIEEQPKPQAAPKAAPAPNAK
jgi:FKBP-type peptidyl-prolyl cis-trans isomerase FklB